MVVGLAAVLQQNLEHFPQTRQDRVLVLGVLDENKLKVIVDEDAAGNDVIWGFTYDGEEIEQEGGGDTNGKGYYAWVWKQEY